jgi:hypothetical protein
MEPTSKTSKENVTFLRLTIASALLLLLSYALAACGTSERPEQLGAAVITQTVAMPTPSSTLTGPELDATKMAPFEWQRQTAVARATEWAMATPVQPTFVPAGPTSTRVPLPPPQLGVRACGDALNRTHVIGNCWSGLIGNEYLHAVTQVRKDDPSDVTLRVMTRTLDLYTRGPEQIYNIPSQQGLAYIASVEWPRMTLVTDRDNPPITTFTFNLLTRAWEQPSRCVFYPFALHPSTLSGGQGSGTINEAPYVVRESTYGTADGNFGWLSWNGDLLTTTLVLSLTPPWSSIPYTNPDDPTDHTVSVGDWIIGRPEVSSSQAIRDALDHLDENGYIVTVPVWNQAINQGGSLRYRVSGFAWVYGIEEYSVDHPNHIALRYWGPATCPNP